MGQPSDDLKCTDEGLLQVVFGLNGDWRQQYNVYMLGGANGRVPIDMLPYLFDGTYQIESKADLSKQEVDLKRSDHMPINLDENN